MKRLLTVSFLLALSTSAFADTTYKFAEMNCVGRIDEKPQGMHEDYVYMGLRLIPFTAVRRDGTKAKSLGWNTFYGATKDQVVKEMEENRYGMEVHYSAPLKQKYARHKLYVYAEKLAGFDESFNLQVVRRDEDRGYDILRGQLVRAGSVVGGYAYDLLCKADR